MGKIARLLGNMFKPQKDRRRDLRQGCALGVDVDCFDRCNCGTLANMSDGGALVQGYLQAAVGDTIRLTVPLGKIQGQIRFVGRVVRSDPVGIGICFQDMAPNHRELIQTCFQQSDSGHLEIIS